MTNSFTLAVGEDGTEELLQAVPEELTDEELLGLKQECTAEGEKRNLQEEKRKNS